MKKASRMILPNNIQMRPICKFLDCTGIFISQLTTLVHKNYQIRARKNANLLGDWQTLKSRKVPDHEIARIINISRATYYRRKKALQVFGIKGLKRKRTMPKIFRTSRIPIETINRILAIRKENPTYDKAKITVIFRRNFHIK